MQSINYSNTSNVNKSIHPMGKDAASDVFKGLQKPLVFHAFKGKFIYWGAGFAVLSLVVGIVLNIVGGYLWGASGMMITLIGGLYATAQRQKRGLHNKTKSKGHYIVRQSH